MIEIRHATTASERPNRGLGASEWNEAHEITGLAEIAGTGSWNDLVSIPAPVAATEEAFTTALKNKLTGLQAGATANSSDGFLLNRQNHTGTLPPEVIDDLAPASMPLAGTEFVMLVQGGVPRKAPASALNGEDAFLGAAAAAEAAQLWAQTIGQVIDFTLTGEAIVTGIAYPFGRTGPAAQTFGYLYLGVKAGTGSVTATILVGGVPTLIDITFNAGTPAATINLPVPPETDIEITFTAIEGAPTLVLGRMQGA